MPQPQPDFATLFTHLKGHPPYPWQTQLFHDLMSDSGIPSDTITAPTGAGKTSLMAVWLCAFALQAASHAQPRIPRRLVWVVNRRVVVDQATAEAEHLADQLNSNPFFKATLGTLSALSADEDLLAVSTLRGQKADNRAWRRNPARPAIIIGTVDMIGSRLLFRGYGDGKSSRPHHAGLLGQDAFIIIDEAHLSPAFVTLLPQLRQFHKTRLKPWNYLFLTATSRGAQRYPVNFNADCEHDGFNARFNAVKRLHLTELPDSKSLRARLLDLALTSEARRVIIFTRKPKDVLDIARDLRRKTNDPVLTITGTHRGYERDQLMQEDRMKALLATTEPATKHILVATSAAEVGMDASSSLLISTLDTADHLIQRFGRLNRFGESPNAEAHILFTPLKDAKKEAHLHQSLAYLRSLNGDASPARILAAGPIPIPPPAATAALHPGHIERWTQTTSIGPAIPQVDPFLHGDEQDAPRTTLVWREDVSLFLSSDLTKDQIEQSLSAHRILAHEKLEAPTSDILDYLKALAGKFPDRECILIAPDGSASTPISLSLALDERGARAFNYATVLLPPDLCFLVEGMLDNTLAEPCRQPDVADISRYAPDGRPRYRYHVRTIGDVVSTRLLGEMPPAQFTPVEINFDDFNTLAEFRFKINPDKSNGQLDDPDSDDDSIVDTLLYIREPKPDEKDQRYRELLDDHLGRVATKARDLAIALGLCDLADIFHAAGLYHDRGKSARIWRSAMRIPKGAPDLAKTSRLNNSRALGGYRHELGSLIDASLLDDLIQHLIATHHGYARPHFPIKARDPDRDTASAAASGLNPGRFARLQAHYGPYELAWLESIFRAADWMISEEKPDNA